MRIAALLVCTLSFAAFGASPLESAVTEFKLANGMRWIVAPSASQGEAALLLYVDAGGAQEAPGQTGLVATLGDMWRLDAPGMEKSGAKRPQVLASNDRIIFRSTWPAAGIEPWFTATAALLKSPPLGRFEEAKASVIAKHNKMLQGGGSLLDDFLATAYLVHPYRHPYYGFPGDLDQLTAADAASFCKTNFVPGNLIAVAAGDVTAAQIQAFAEKHFRDLPANAVPAPLRSVEPVQRSERRLVFHAATRPAVVVAYHCVSIADAAAPVHGVLRALVARRLKSRLLERDKLVSRIDTHPYPAMKYPFLLMILSFVNQGTEPAAVERTIHEELEKLAAVPAAGEELAPLLASGAGEDPAKLAPFELATELADWHAMSGTWRTMFRYPECKGKVTAGQVQELARRLFVPNQRTVALTQ